MDTPILYFNDVSPPCRAVLMLCKEIGLDVNIHHMDLVTGSQCEDWFLKINPYHGLPTFQDEDGFVIWESRTIMRYIVEKYGTDDRLYPKELKTRTLVDRALDYDGGCLYRAVADFAYPVMFGFSPGTTDRERAERLIMTRLEQVDRCLAEGDGRYMVGDHLTIADLATVVSITFLEPINFDFSPFPHIQKWVALLKALPYYDQVHEQYHGWEKMLKNGEWNAAPLPHMK